MNSNTPNNVATLAVAADLVRCLVSEVAGNEIADSIEGRVVNVQTIQDLALAVFNEKLK